MVATWWFSCIKRGSNSWKAAPQDVVDDHDDDDDDDDVAVAMFGSPLHRRGLRKALEAAAV